MTSSTARPDIALDGNEYTWVGYSDDGDANCSPLRDGPLFAPEAPVGALGPARTEHTRIRRAANPSGRRNEIHPGGCDACGQMNLRYRHYFRHDPTGDVIVLGDQCVNKMDFDSITDYTAAKRVRAQREEETVAVETAKWIGQHVEFYDRLKAATEKFDNSFLADLYAKLHKYGSLSDKQVSAAETSITRAEQWERERAEEDAGEWQPVPEEIRGQRVALTGKVLKFTWRDSAYGGAFKLLLHEDRGFKVWATAPNGIIPEVDIDASKETGNPNPRVTFTGKIEVSDRDECFAFASRPTKASILEEKAV